MLDLNGYFPQRIEEMINCDLKSQIIYAKIVSEGRLLSINDCLFKKKLRVLSYFHRKSSNQLEIELF